MASSIVVPEMPYSSIPGEQDAEGNFYFTKAASEIAEEYHIDEAVMAMEKASDVKTSDIVKEVPATVEEIVESDPDSNFRLKGLRISIHTDEPIPTEQLNNMGERFNLENILGTMISLGVIPTPKEFQRLALCSCGQQPYADALDEANMVFDHEMPVKAADAYEPANLVFNPGLAEELGKSGILEKRSYWPQHLAKRASLIKQAIDSDEFFEKYPIKKNPQPIKKVPEDMQEKIIAEGINRSNLGSGRNHHVLIGDQSRYIPGLPEGMTVEHKANPLIPIAALAAIYAGVQFMAGATNSPLGKAMRADPKIAAGVFGAAAAISWLGRKMGLGPAPGQKTASLISKGTMIADDIILQALSGIALAYALAGRAEEKRIRGIQPNVVEEAFEKRPLIGAGLTTAALRGVVSAARKFAQPIEDMDKSLIPSLNKMADAIAYDNGIADTFSIKQLDKFSRNSLTHSAERLLNNTP